MPNLKLLIIPFFAALAASPALASGRGADREPETGMGTRQPPVSAPAENRPATPSTGNDGGMDPNLSGPTGTGPAGSRGTTDPNAAPATPSPSNIGNGTTR